MEISEIIPDLLDRETVRICWGIRHPEEKAPQPLDMFSAEGITIEKDRCVLVYEDYTREGVIKTWKEMKLQWVHLSGGWSNGMTPELNLYPSLPGDVQFRERRIEDVIQGLKGRPPIYFDYISGWKQMLEAKGKEFSEQLKIGELLSLGGAPTHWDLYATVNGKDKFLGRSTPIPFPATEDEPGFLITIKEPFERVKLGISNVTGSRGFGTVGLNYLMVFLRHSRKRAKETYLKDSKWRAEQMKEPPYNIEEIWKYADGFFESAELVKEDLQEILKRYTSEEIIGVQYAVRQYIADGLPSAINRFPRVQPYCFVLTERGWELAVE